MHVKFSERASLLEMSTSEAAEPVRKDFRSSYYYKSLHGFKGGERSLGHLEALLSMSVLDIEKLRQFCLQHTLPVYCRPLIWKVLLGVLPVHTDKDTTRFIEEQKAQQYSDLRHALQIMGRIATPTHTHQQLHQVTKRPLLKPCGDDVTTTQVTSDPSASEEFVLVYLLESNRLLTATDNHLKKPAQLRLRLIADAFLSMFDDEGVCARYWMFSGFINMSAIIVLPHLDKLVSECLSCLAIEESVLYSHLKSIGAISHALPLTRWFSECFAADLPESCLESVWDRVVAGSCAVLAFVGAAILLSVKRRVLGLSSHIDLTHVLHTIPKENFTAIVSKGLQLWETRGSPLLPP